MSRADTAQTPVPAALLVTGAPGSVEGRGARLELPYESVSTPACQNAPLDSRSPYTKAGTLRARPPAAAGAVSVNSDTVTAAAAQIHTVGPPRYLMHTFPHIHSPHAFPVRTPLTHRVAQVWIPQPPPLPPPTAGGRLSLTCSGSPAFPAASMAPSSIPQAGGCAACCALCVLAGEAPDTDAGPVAASAPPSSGTATSMAGGGVAGTASGCTQ